MCRAFSDLRYPASPASAGRSPPGSFAWRVDSLTMSGIPVCSARASLRGCSPAPWDSPVDSGHSRLFADMRGVAAAPGRLHVRRSPTPPRPAHGTEWCCAHAPLSRSTVDRPKCAADQLRKVVKLADQVWSNARIATEPAGHRTISTLGAGFPYRRAGIRRRRGTRHCVRFRTPPGNLPETRIHPAKQCRRRNVTSARTGRPGCRPGTTTTPRG